MVAFVVFVVFLTCVGLPGTVVSVADLTSKSCDLSHVNLPGVNMSYVQQQEEQKHADNQWAAR